METNDQQVAAQYSQEQYKARMQLLRSKWNARRRKILLYIPLGLLGSLLVLWIISLFSRGAAAIVGFAVFGTAFVAAMCKDPLPLLKPFREASSDPVVTLQTYYDALTIIFERGKISDDDMAKAFVCSIESTLQDDQSIRDYATKRLSEAKAVSIELAKCVRGIGIVGKNCSQILGKIEFEIEDETDKFKTYKVTIPVRYESGTVKNGIAEFKTVARIVVTENKKMIFLWGKWFVINSEFSVTV